MSNARLPTLDWQVVLNRASPAGHAGWDRVRVAQLRELRRALKVAAIGQTLNAVLLAIVLRGSVPSIQLTLWLLGLGFLILTGALVGRRRIADTPAASRQALDRASHISVLYGFAWAVPAFIFFPAALPHDQLAICLVTASMMAGAAFVFTATPAAAAGYILVMGAATTKMLGYTESTLLLTLGPIYTVGLLFAVLGNGRAFMRRRMVDLALEERSDTISLLLKEYESSDADWLWETDADLRFRNVSPRFARALGLDAGEIEAMTLDALLSQDAHEGGSSGEIGTAVAGLAAHSGFADLLIAAPHPDGARCIQLSARPRFGPRGGFLGYRGVGSDVTETQQAARRIAHMARHDPLTGLPNRLQLLEALGTALSRARDADRLCAILLIDLDRFKNVNDTLGHVAGDHLLQQVTQRLAPVLAPGMTLGRLGGDEFALVIPDAIDAAAIERLCVDIVETMKQPFLYLDQHLFVGASIGAALGPQDGESVEDMMRSADLALHRAKADGGGDVYFYERGLHEQAEERRQIELSLRTALDARELALVYQPVVEAGTGRIHGFEALLRWQNARLGEVSPAKFVAIAEETGLIGRIGEWALRNALAEAASWPGDINVAVNISPVQLHEPGFMLTLISALSQSGLDPHRLELEITETVFLQLTPLTQKVLHQIRALGIRLAIDDFGTGYSSLAYVRDSRFDTIKVDRSFIAAVCADDPGSSAIVRAIVAMAGSLSMDTVAEGVETGEQLAAVRAFGCTRVQGFVFARPCTAAEARKLLTANHGRIAA
ncbi:putative bifunctional diguanylate cyclase/phosphodiesterase [Allosphingosinicella indica]|uniref:Diguanylate cyclase/phosphodiesterase with PAS/PAC sensor(S) n=1 Tax=Allosphingosinicella indica TaxID=941907 RepID=A0A1X7GTC0_9SPHN|nr:EAL domain-containing protein [Allosphingosinicella indica]SMF74382.1 diguanylate cyclase/phosphodiesterase with PAS/PAC sensor(s) [Allosphingosinicella indica]